MTTQPTTPTESLDEFRNATAATELGEITAWTIDTEQKAIWAARKLARIRKLIDAHRETYEREVHVLQQWLESVTSPLEREAASFEGMLIHYHEGRLLDDPKAKTIKLPGVELKARKQAPEWKVSTEEFVAWARTAAPSLVKITEDVKLAEAKKALGELARTELGEIITVDGEIVPGVIVTERDPKFSAVVS